MHSRNISAPGGASTFVTGIQFVDDEPTNADIGVEDLIDKLK